MRTNGRGKRLRWTLAALAILSLMGCSADWGPPPPEEQGPGVNPNAPQRKVNLNVDVTGIDPPIWKLSLTSEEVIVTGDGPNDWNPVPRESGGPKFTTLYQSEEWLGTFQTTLQYNSGLRLRIHLTALVQQGRINMSLADGPRNRCGPKAETFAKPGIMECIIITNR